MILNGRVINPGELRTPINLGSRTVATQPGGFKVPSFARFATVYARWKNAHGAESAQAAAEGGEAPATVLIRYYASLNETCGVQLGADWYEIVSIDDIEQRHEYMELQVKRWRPG